MSGEKDYPFLWNKENKWNHIIIIQATYSTILCLPMPKSTNTLILSKPFYAIATVLSWGCLKALET